VVKVAEVTEEKTKSGLYVPDTAKEKPQEQLKFSAVGPGARDEKGERIPMDVKVGDISIVLQVFGTEIKVDGEEYLVLSEGHILAILN
jgi:chaperonin GroES